MSIKPILIVTALLAATPAMAEDAAPAGALTASVAGKATYLVTSNGQTAQINRIIAASDGGVSGVSVIYNDAIYLVPGATVSAGEKNRLKTSLSSKEVRALKTQ